MPDVEPLRFPSREGRASVNQQADLQTVCSGRRRTCALLNSPLPSVNSAIEHIQELRKKVEDWCQQSGKYQRQTDRHRHHETLRFYPRDTESEMSTKLFVEGFAIGTRESCPLSPLLKKINDVLGEVVYLIERLEADRQYAEEALCKEKRRKRYLENKVDSISLLKQQEHSVVIQKEHEACIRDVSELKWQLKLEKEKLVQVQEKMQHTEILNQHLHEDINFAKKQIHIVKENLDLQRGIINEINIAQVEAHALYSKTQNDLILFEEELKKMEVDDKNEKTSMEHALLDMKNQLANRLEDLNQLKMLEKNLCAEIEDAEQTVELTKEKCAAIKQRVPELKEQEKTEKNQISVLKCQIEGEMQTNKKLTEKLTGVHEEIQKTKLTGEAEVSSMEEQLRAKRDAFAALRKENMENELKIEDYKWKISESEKAVKHMHDEREQMLQKISDNDKQWEKAREKVTHVVAWHSVTRVKLEEQEQLTFMEEQRAKKEIENLRKDLASQVIALELLKGQCASISDEMFRHQRSSELANQNLQSEFEHASAATKSLESRMETIKKLIENMEKIEADHRNTLANFEREKKRKSDQLRTAKDLQAATSKRYDDTLVRISDLIRKCEEYRDASNELKKNVASMPDIIAKLQRAFGVVKLREESAALVMSTLQSDINTCLHRTQRSLQTHSAHVTARKKEMENIKEALHIALEENKQLASEYQSLKKILMDAKQEAVCVLSKKSRAHKTFHLYTQLSLLQKRMHKALVKYFKQRSLYSQAELDRCQSLCQETDQKIKTAQTLQGAAMSQRPSLKRPQQITAQGREEWGIGGGAIRELQSVKDKRAGVFKRTTPSPVTAQHRVHQSRQLSL
ncbi:LOW QUALITY PROTEIN: coiled-coil domain-containing protein 178 [Aulostomus maculatus]